MAQWSLFCWMWNDGDVLYGLDRPRAEARSALLQYLAHCRDEDGNRVQIIEPQRITDQRIFIQNQLTDATVDVLALNGHPRPKYIKPKKSTVPDVERAKGYQNFLKNHPKFNMNRPLPEGDVMTKAGRAWKRTSKAGLEYQAKQRGGRVHFIIDDLDWDQIATKDAQFGRSVTSSEIRWLYRQRNDPQVTRNVIYWKDGKVSQSPWQLAPDAFAQYHPSSEA